MVDLKKAMESLTLEDEQGTRYTITAVYSRVFASQLPGILFQFPNGFHSMLTFDNNDDVKYVYDALQRVKGVSNG